MFLMPIQPPIRFRSSTSLSVLHENSSALQTPCDHTLLLHPQRLRFLHLRLLRPRIHHPRIPRDRSAPFAKTLVRSCARGSPMPTMLGVPCIHLIVTVVIMDASAQIAKEERQTTKIQSPLSCIQVKCKKKDCETTPNVEYRHQNRSESFDLSHPFIRCPGTLGSPSVIMLAMSTP